MIFNVTFKYFGKYLTMIYKYQYSYNYLKFYSHVFWNERIWLKMNLKQLTLSSEPKKSYSRSLKRSTDVVIDSENNIRSVNNYPTKLRLKVKFFWSDKNGGWFKIVVQINVCNSSNPQSFRGASPALPPPPLGPLPGLYPRPAVDLKVVSRPLAYSRPP